jgi:RHS repeat-associated protein
VYTPDQFGGGYNDGEFTVSGTSFTPNKLVVARKYYDAGGARVAMRENGTLYWLLTDYLGSTSKVANSDGSFHSEQMYKPFGEKRYPTGASTLPTTYRYTGQRSETGLGPAGGEGLMFYGARWYDALLGRFLSADSIIPGAGNPQAWDRYAGMMNNPVKFNDPSGHSVDNCPPGDTACEDMQYGEEDLQSYENMPESYEIVIPTNAILLDGGPGVIPYSQAAEDNWNGYLNSGATGTPFDAV